LLDLGESPRKEIFVGGRKREGRREMREGIAPRGGRKGARDESQNALVVV